jgi:hypothetical protein
MVTAAFKHMHAAQSRQQQADCVHITHQMLLMASPLSAAVPLPWPMCIVATQLFSKHKSTGDM